MGKSDKKQTGENFFSGFYPNRREFIKISALGAMVASGTPAMAKHLGQFDSSNSKDGRDNQLPGRIVICHNPEMNGHGTIDTACVEEMVLRSVRMLTSESDTGQAFESLFPGLHSGSTFAIKVNCIGSTCSRWEVVRGIVVGLSQMLGGTFDISNVLIFDNRNISYYGYNATNFTVGSNTAVIATGNSGSSGYYPYGSYQLSNHLIDRDYVINVPALKSHSDGNNQITVAMKNHYGSCSPASLCGNTIGMLTVNADQYIAPKTGLVVTDCLRGTWTGGPGGAPMMWNTYPEGTPNTLLVTTDPTTNEYWARDMINAERATHSYSPKPCPWIEVSSGSPWFLGVSDPAEMTVLMDNQTGIEADPGAMMSGTFMAPNSPNPFSSRTTIRFRLAQDAEATIQIVDIRGRAVRHLASQSFPAGYSNLSWDARDRNGRRVPAGVYFARLQVGRMVKSQRLVVTR